MRTRNYALAVALLVCATQSFAQTPISAATCGKQIDLTASLLSDARRSLQRTLGLTVVGTRSELFRSRSTATPSCIEGAPFLERWNRGDPAKKIALLPIEAGEFGNTAYPRSVNDGAAWNGVGINFGVTAGVRGTWRFLTASIAPEVYYQQNEPFDYVPSNFTGKSGYANPYHPGIDYPTRFGPKSFTTFSPGQSYIQAAYKNISATFGTENLWIGAADVHPILMSYTAPGFPHVRLGTQNSIDVKIARIEFQMLFGSVTQSNYFDGESGEDTHYFGTTMLIVEPKFVPGLYLGILRAVHDSAKATGQSPAFYLSRNIRTFFGSEAGGNLVSDNAIGVLLGRWMHPASGFEAYVEWSREDTPGGWLDVLREPDWTQAYVFGVQKTFVRPDRMTRLYAEAIHLGESAPARAGRGFFSYYTHSAVPQGHTNDGQLLGAAIGPGSDAQLIGVDVFSANGRSAFRIERARYDDDTYYRTFARRFGETRHDAEITLSASRLQFIGALEIEAGLAISRRYGRQFLTLGTGDAPDTAETNWGTRLTAAWPLPF